MDQNEKNQIRAEMEFVMQELKEKGVAHNATPEELERMGLGDVVEAALNKFGITEQKFKSWFGLQECRCTQRKAFLNNLFSWHRKKKANGDTPSES